MAGCFGKYEQVITGLTVAEYCSHGPRLQILFKVSGVLSGHQVTL